MRLQLSDVLGLTIGFSMGSVALAAYLVFARAPTLDHPADPTVMVPPPPASGPTVKQARPPPPTPVTHATMPRAQRPPEPETAQPVPPLPRVNRPGTPGVPPLPNGVAMLPNVVHPTDKTRPGNISGTGFFIAGDGTILTAAHVVDGCQSTKIISDHVRPADANVLAVDAGHDLALLRAKVRPPALLGLTTRPAENRHLLVFGYPAYGDPRVATEAPARTRPDMAEALGWSKQDSPGMWLDAGDVRQGFSGGPVITADGEVIGLIKAILLRSAISQGVEGKPSGIAIGPDTKTIATFLRREAPEWEPEADWKQQASDTVTARKAVVHVFCLR